MSDRDQIEAKVYDALVSFNATAAWDILRLAQMRQYLAEHLANALRPHVAELEAEREKLVRWHGEDSATINRLVARVERRQAQLVALRNDALSMRGSLAPADGDRKVPFELGETLTPAVDWLIARVAELEKERHSTNEALSDAAEALRRQRDRITELEAPAAAHQRKGYEAAIEVMRQEKLPMSVGLLEAQQELDKLDGQAPPLTVFRASHDSIVMGLYATREAARVHCETVLRREIGDTGDLGWIPDDGSAGSPEELSVFGPGVDEDGVPYDTATGYVVTPLEVAAAYDAEADE